MSQWPAERGWGGQAKAKQPPSAALGAQHRMPAFVCAGRLFTTDLTLKATGDYVLPDFNLELGLRKRHLQDRDDVTGPIRFVPGTSPPSLVAFGEDTVFNVDIDAPGDSYRTHHLDMRWDEMSGLAFTNYENGTVLLHVTSLLFMSKVCTTTLMLPLRPDELSARPSWQDAIAESRAAWGTYNWLFWVF